MENKNESNFSQRKRRAKQTEGENLYLKVVGARLVSKMEQKSLTNIEVAEILECTPAHVIALKKGTAVMNILELLRLCGYMWISPNEILDPDYDANNKKKEVENEKITQKLQQTILEMTPVQRQALLLILGLSPE